MRKALKNKKALSVSALAALLLIGGILAYQSSSDSADNLFGIGSDRTQIVEKYEPPATLEAGISFPKEVQVVNNGNAPVYVRVMALFTDESVLDYTTLDYNTSAWDYNSNDGYWYYKQPLEAGKKTDPLFQTVSISRDVSDGDIKDFEILIYHESCEKGTHETYEEAWTDFLKNLDNGFVPD